MHDSVITFISDLAVIMIVAGFVTIIFHRLKQPVVLGYIVAGILIGPHTPPFELIRDEHTIKVLAELGVIFLMFSLGLEFSIRKLLKVGATALIAAVLEIVVMIWLGYQIGLWLGWNNNLDALFLGAILAISSTTIIVKALNDLKMKHERFAQLIFGVLIVEDILDSGNTLSYLLQLLQARSPASVRLCTLLDKPSRRTKEVELHYSGFTIPDYFVVGYGLDYAEKYRNLPYIGILKPCVYGGEE